MPTIKEYSSQVRATGPVEGRNATGSDFGAAQAQGLQDLGQGLITGADQVEKHITRGEISDTNAKMAQAGAQWTKELKDRIGNAQPGDTSFVSNFQKDYDTSMDKIAEGIQTPLAQAHFEELRAHQSAAFTQTANAGQAELAKEKAILDRESTINGLENQLRLDPGSMEAVQQQYAISQKASNAAGLDSSDLLKLQQKEMPRLYRSQVLGEIEQDPDKAILKLESGDYGNKLSEESVQALLTHARTYKNALYTEDQRQKAQDQEVKAQKQEEILKGFNKDLASNALSVKDVLAEGDLDAHQQEHYINMIRERAREPVKTNPKVFTDAFSRIHLPDGDPQKITNDTQLNQLFLDHKVAYEGGMSLQDLRAELAGSKTTEGRNAAFLRNRYLNQDWKDQFTKGLIKGLPDPEGPRKYSEFLTFAMSEEERVKSEGKSINVLYNPKSPEFLGQYVRPASLTEVTSNMAKRIGSGQQPPSINNPDPAPERDNNSQPQGINPIQQKYNDILRDWGGTPDQAFGPNGEPPQAINPVVAGKAAALVPTADADKITDAQKAQDFVAKQQAIVTQKAVQQKTQELDEQNKARAALGMPPLSLTPLQIQKAEDTKRRSGETPADYLARMKGSK